MGPPIILLAVAAASVAFFLMPVHYTSGVLMVLTTSTKGPTLSLDPARPDGLSNPLLTFGDGLKTTSAILIQAMNDPDVKAELGAPENGPTQITVDDGRTNPNLLDTTGPFVYIAVDARTGSEASGIVGKAQQRVRAELDARQKELGAPKGTFITAADVSPATVPEQVLSGKIQAALAAFLLFAIAGFGVAYARARSKLSKGPVATSTKSDPGIYWAADDTQRLSLPRGESRTPSYRPIIQSGPGTVEQKQGDYEPARGSAELNDDDTQVVIVLSDMAGGDSGIGARPSINGKARDRRGEARD
ncbi:hypothetical protein [Planotetraspora kaengkrachanensis]|uniref:hypothetical protein n=1 Tax=Planotetraspora kaengkrachanensis TaxID=575193 RepID=UPI001942A402|nr:hypothetical protein [Planotetraspora kaengkrachanensis]